MPTSVIVAAAAAGAGSVVAGAAASAGWLVAGSFAATAISAAASMVVGGVLRNALAPSGGSPNTPAGFTAAAEGRDQVVRSAVANRTIVYGRAMVSGPLVFAASALANRTLWLVIPLAGHEIDAVETVYLNDVALPSLGDIASGPYAGNVRVNARLGTLSQAADADLVAADIGWTSAHRLAGVAYIVVRMNWSQDVFPQGIPNVKAIIRGKKLFDPRTSTTAWSQNPALAARDYLTSNYGLEADSSEIDAALCIAAANVCDEDVAILPSGTEKRYTCNGVMDTGDTPRTIMEAIQSSMAGFCVYSAGTYRLHAAAYTTPAVTLTADNLAGSVKVRPRITRKDLYNAVRGTFVDPAAYWQPTDFPGQSNSTYAANDGNQVIWRDIALPCTTSSATAQRIAKLMLERSRQGITVDFPANLTAFKIAVMDTVMLTMPQLGWSAKEFLVVDWEFSQEGGVNLVLQEETSASYAWNSGLQTVRDPAPDTNLPDPFTVAAPGAPSVAESLYQTTGSAGVKSRATVSWAAVTDAFVTAYLLDYKAAADTNWTLLPEVRGTSADISDLAPGTYNFRLRAINSVDQRSAYSPTTTKELLGLSAAPANLSGLSVIAIAGRAYAGWNLSPDLDVRIGGRVVIRHTPLTSGAIWENGIGLDELNGDAVSATLPLLTGTYMAKAVDSSGNYSQASVNYVATESQVTGFTVTHTSTQAPAFAGTKTSVAVDSSTLKLDSVTPIDSMASMVDSWSYIDSLGGVVLAGSYAFDNVMNFGGVVTRRLNATVQALSSDTGDLIDTRGNVDDWDSLDGGVINDTEATLYYSTTQTNPAGSPVWSAWAPFLTADVTCWAVKYRLDMASASPTHNIAVSTLTVVARSSP
jgi:hypothetical protein